MLRKKPCQERSREGGIVLGKNKTSEVWNKMGEGGQSNTTSVGGRHISSLRAKRQGAVSHAFSSLTKPSKADGYCRRKLNHIKEKGRGTLGRRHINDAGAAQRKAEQRKKAHAQFFFVKKEKAWGKL